MKKHKTSGFTLIELLVVIAIIAIITAIVTANFNESRSRARDAKRVSDVSQIQLALELYYDRCRAYPNPTSGNIINQSTRSANNAFGGNICSNGITFGEFISQVPTPPTSSISQPAYRYAVNGDNNNYVIGIQLEKNNPALVDDFDTNDVFGSGIYCDDSGNNYCVTSR